METRAEEIARRVAENAAQRMVSLVFGRAGYSVASEEDLQRLAEDLRFVGEQRARHQFRKEHQFRAWMVVLGAVLTAGLGAIGAFVATWAVTIIGTHPH